MVAFLQHPFMQEPSDCVSSFPSPSPHIFAFTFSSFRTAHSHPFLPFPIRLFRFCSSPSSTSDHRLDLVSLSSTDPFPSNLKSCFRPLEMPSSGPPRQRQRCESRHRHGARPSDKDTTRLSSRMKLERNLHRPQESAQLGKNRTGILDTNRAAKTVPSVH
jgi:hypothetical protein